MLDYSKYFCCVIVKPMLILPVVALIVVTLIWGTTFVVVKDTLDAMPASLLLAIRFSMAFILLAPWVKPAKHTLKPAFILGILLFIGYGSQTIGLVFTSASKAAFITGFSVILTPLLSTLFWRNHIANKVYLAAIIALIGLGLLSLTGARGLNIGDIWVIGTAFAYALFIVYLGEIVHEHKIMTLNAMSLYPLVLLTWLWALPHIGLLGMVSLKSYLALFYLASFATVLTSILQTWAQRQVPAYLAALIFLLEPVFAALFAYMFLGEVLGVLAWCGGLLILIAILISETPWKILVIWARKVVLKVF